MPPNEMVVINANIEIAGPTLQKIVQTAKNLKGPDEKGYFRIDTAELVSDLISRFLAEQGFDAYVADRRHYASILADGNP